MYVSTTTFLAVLVGLGQVNAKGFEVGKNLKPLINNVNNTASAAVSGNNNAAKGAAVQSSGAAAGVGSLKALPGSFQTNVGVLQPLPGLQTGGALKQLGSASAVCFDDL